MVSKTQIQYIRSLTIHKFRNKNRQFIVEGPKLVSELLSSKFPCDKIYALEEWINNYRDKVGSKVEIIEISQIELKKISSQKTPNQVLAVVNMHDPPKWSGSPNMKGITLLLDGISDPGNMGTIIRTSDWFGIDNIICSENCVDVYNPKVIQATMGSIFRIGIYYVEIDKYLQNLPTHLTIYGTVLDGENIYEQELEKNCIVLIGNESHGISENLIPFIKKKIRIPDYSNGKSFTAESLNVSVAAAIVIAEFRRKIGSESD